jgi:hypothetical protein
LAAGLQLETVRVAIVGLQLLWYATQQLPSFIRNTCLQIAGRVGQWFISETCSLTQATIKYRGYQLFKGGLNSDGWPKIVT